MTILLLTFTILFFGALNSLGLGIVGTYANAMAVAADAPATLASWIEWARAQRRPLRYATPGVGTAAHFTGEFLRQLSGSSGNRPASSIHRPAPSECPSRMTGRDGA